MLSFKNCLEIKEDTCQKNPERQHLFSVGGNWTWHGIDRDYFIPKLDEALRIPSLELSRLVWRTAVLPCTRPVAVLSAAYKESVP